MGIADRDYMRERHRKTSEHALRSGPPEPSATSTLWSILFFVALAFLGYKAAIRWDSTHAKAPNRVAPIASVRPPASAVPAAIALPAPQRHAPAVYPNLTGNWDPNRPMQPSTPAPQPAATTIVIKCVINGTTTYVESESDCLARAKATVVTIDPRQNLSDGLPNASQIIQRPSPGVQVNAAPAAVDLNVQRKAFCRAYEEEIKQIDAHARQPLSGAEQDWWAAKRKKARDEQFRLHC
jgi:hypothetical protein